MGDRNVNFLSSNFGTILVNKHLDMATVLVTFSNSRTGLDSNPINQATLHTKSC